MKKVISILIISSFLLSLCACGGSSALRLGESAVDTDTYFASKPDYVSRTLSLPSVFANGMVLQGNQSINIYGRAMPGKEVKVCLDDKEYKTLSDERTSCFIISLPAEKPSFEPHTLSVSCENETKTFSDVLIGEVFYCGGQSNMQLTMNNAEWYSDYYTSKFDSFEDNEAIRQFLVPIGSSPKIEFDCGGTWQKAVKGNFGDFAPLSYLFACEVFASENVPVGLVMCSGGGSCIQSWLSANDQKTGISRSTKGDALKATLYNKMVSPLFPYSYAAVLWYQGEANADFGEYDKYVPLLQNLVNSYRRELYAPNMPFYICELAAFNGGDTYTLIRDAQVKATSALENAFLIPNFDLGSMNDIHPRTKDILAKRIHAAYLDTLCNVKTDWRAPSLISAESSGDTLTLAFDNVGDGLKVKDSSESLSGFKIAGDDGKYFDADAEITGKNTVALKSKSVPEPKTVRYNFKAFEIGSLENSYGIQPFLFRTDDSELKIRGKFIIG